MYKLQLKEIKESLDFQKALSIKLIEHNNFSEDGFWTQGAHTIKTHESTSDIFDNLNIFFLHIQSMPYYSRETYRGFELWDDFFEEEYIFEPIDVVEYSRLANYSFELFRGFAHDSFWNCGISLNHYIKGYKVSKDLNGATWLICETKEHYYSFIYFGLD